MKSSPLIVAMGVCHRDVELAALWLRWVNFLCSQPDGDNSANILLIVHSKRATPFIESLKKALRGTLYGEFATSLVECPDENEDGYPKSASHLFLRTLEIAKKQYPKSAVLWCEPDTVPLRPTWFTEIADAYANCGKPFFGTKVGTQFPHLGGNSVYPHNWRKLAPSIARVVKAPDYKLWGPGKGQPWDVFCRDETTAQMADSKLWHHVWKERELRATQLKDIPPEACIFHQDKSGALIREIASERYPDFMPTVNEPRRFFVMNGHPSRLRAKGLTIKFSYSKWSVSGWRSAVCSDELSSNEASAITALVGQLGIRETTEGEFLKLSGRKSNSLPLPRITVVPHAKTAKNASVFVMLGRYGDICNILPMLKSESDAGRRPTLVVGRDFQDILDGVSYVDRLVWDGPYEGLPECLRWLRRDKEIPMPIVCQFHHNPIDNGRLTDSYQKEVWRLAGRLKDFESRGPLVFDRRDFEREAQLWNRPNSMPLVLVGLESVSSPLKSAKRIREAIREQLGVDFNVVDLSSIRAERIYDLIGLYERAACIVSSDTVHLHLARACKTPILALVNDGWRGSVTPDLAIDVLRYAELPKRIDEIPKIIQAAITRRAQVEIAPAKSPQSPPGRPTIYHVVDGFGNDPRHQDAQATWNQAYLRGIIPVHVNGYPRNAKTELGDPRPLPFLKDILWAAIPADATGAGDHIIVWTNSDIGLKAGLADVILEHVGRHGAASMRRTESNGKGHPGRDLFAFTIDWLHAHWDEFPDYVIGAPTFDLGLVAMIRKSHGLPTNLKNMGDDLAPADMSPGFALHTSHAPEWQVKNMDSIPSVRHNKRLFREWAHKYAPEIGFSKGGNLQ